MRTNRYEHEFEKVRLMLGADAGELVTVRRMRQAFITGAIVQAEINNAANSLSKVEDRAQRYADLLAEKMAFMDNTEKMP